MKPYTTSTNMALENLESTQNFISFMMGFLGSVLALAKLV